MRRLNYIDTEFKWDNLRRLKPHKFKCGYCDAQIQSSKGWRMIDESRTNSHKVFVNYMYCCPECKMMTFVDNYKDYQFPEAVHGHKLDYLVEDVSILYEEARECYSIHCYNSAALICREILKSIAVNEGAPEEKSLIYYLEFLEEHNFVPRKPLDLVGKVKDGAHKTSKEFEDIGRDKAQDIMEVTENILQYLYGYEMYP